VSATTRDSAWHPCAYRFRITTADAERMRQLRKMSPKGRRDSVAAVAAELNVAQKPATIRSADVQSPQLPTATPAPRLVRRG
jgi:hypothetical protein